MTLLSCAKLVVKAREGGSHKRREGGSALKSGKLGQDPRDHGGNFGIAKGNPTGGPGPIFWVFGYPIVTLRNS